MFVVGSIPIYISYVRVLNKIDQRISIQIELYLINIRAIGLLILSEDDRSIFNPEEISIGASLTEVFDHTHKLDCANDRKLI